MADVVIAGTKAIGSEYALDVLAQRRGLTRHVDASQLADQVLLQAHALLTIKGVVQQMAQQAEHPDKDAPVSHRGPTSEVVGLQTVGTDRGLKRLLGRSRVEKPLALEPEQIRLQRIHIAIALTA